MFYAGVGFFPLLSFLAFFLAGAAALPSSSAALLFFATVFAGAGCAAGRSRASNSDLTPAGAWSYAVLPSSSVVSMPAPLPSSSSTAAETLKSQIGHNIG